MNPKVQKLRAEREKNAARIERLRERNKVLDADILSLENEDIIGMVREHGLSPEMLFKLLKAMKTNPLPPLPETYQEPEELYHEE